VMGGYGHHAPAEASLPTLSDAQGRIIPAPAAPAGARPQMVRSGDEQALAAWIADEHAVVSKWTPATQWTAPQPLERIYGESSNVQLASNGAGRARLASRWGQRRTHHLRPARHHLLHSRLHRIRQQVGRPHEAAAIGGERHDLHRSVVMLGASAERGVDEAFRGIVARDQAFAH